jgi:peptidoglycan/LPS O-acetylase OafA/YrhL
MRESRLGYRPALDGVRGIAIAIVVAFHAFHWPAAGTLGVDLFFVLSGFLITTLLLEEHARSGRIRIGAFYIRRARRLLPALFAMLAPFLLIAVSATALGGGAPGWLWLRLAAALTYTSNVLVAADPTLGSFGLIHLWSLAAEEQFYIVWPLLLLVVIRRVGTARVGRVLVLLLFVAVTYRLQLLLRGASIERVYYGPDTHADSLLIGCIFGSYYVRGRLPQFVFGYRSRGVSITVSLAVVLVAAVLVSRFPSRLTYETQLLPTAFAVAAGVFIVSAAIGGSLVARALAVRPLVFLGRISYSLYLWHLPLLVALAGTHHGFGVRTATAVVIALLVATGSRYLVELPVLARGRSVTPKPGQPAPLAATA